MKYILYYLTDGIDQFGQAYASGQINSSTLAEIKEEYLPSNVGQKAVDDLVNIATVKVNVLTGELEDLPVETPPDGE